MRWGGAVGRAYGEGKTARENFWLRWARGRSQQDCYQLPFIVSGQGDNGCEDVPSRGWIVGGGVWEWIVDVYVDVDVDECVDDIC